MRGTEQVFEWYRRYTESASSVLDWGCRHAPDACLIAQSTGGRIDIHGCDTVDAEAYRVFHDAAGLDYRQLDHEYLLPYDAESFDVIIAAGVLEHVPMEYESIKELSRVIKKEGTLVVTFLPNRWSVHELSARRAAAYPDRAGQPHHLRTYGRGGVRHLLQSAGFVVTEIGFQTHFGLLPLEPDPTATRRMVSRLGRTIGIARLAPCLALVARRLAYF